jgi:hypothetical protein
VVHPARDVGDQGSAGSAVDQPGRYGDADPVDHRAFVREEGGHAALSQTRPTEVEIRHSVDRFHVLIC